VGGVGVATVTPTPPGGGSAAGKSAKTDSNQAGKDTVTGAAGRVWDACDVLVDVAGKGVIGFVIRRVEQYRDLVRDAVEEIEEWDPDEEGDEFFDELLGDEGEKNDADDEEEEEEEEEDDEDDDQASKEALHAQKKSTLRVLKPIAQIYPVIISNRLTKASGSLGDVRKLEALMGDLQHIPEHVDEVAGALYEADLEKAGQFLRKARDCASNAINSVVWPGNGKETGEQIGDKFTTWSNTWMKVMEEVSKPIDR
ncbi:hypothetical protein AOCH_002792, partial [Aspergillus ochraceoroseus]